MSTGCLLLSTRCIAEALMGYVAWASRRRGPGPTLPRHARPRRRTVGVHRGDGPGISGGPRWGGAVGHLGRGPAGLRRRRVSRLIRPGFVPALVGAGTVVTVVTSRHALLLKAVEFSRPSRAGVHRGHVGPGRLLTVWAG